LRAIGRRGFDDQAQPQTRIQEPQRRRPALTLIGLGAAIRAARFVIAGMAAADAVRDYKA
jgi:hypothetical protein